MSLVFSVSIGAGGSCRSDCGPDSAGHQQHKQQGVPRDSQTGDSPAGGGQHRDTGKHLNTGQTQRYR